MTGYDHLLGHYNLSLVLLSYIIAVCAALLAIELAGRVKVAQGVTKGIWLISGGAVLGSGIWSMHFIGMMAHSFEETVFFDPTIVFLSLVASVIGCISGFSIMYYQRHLEWRIFIGSLFMGGGIASMHYIGMEAMEPINTSYNYFYVLISVVLAVLASALALWIGFSDKISERKVYWKKKGLFSFVMALAITGMHYIGMEATTFYPLSESDNLNLLAQWDISSMKWIVLTGTMIMFTMTFLFILIDRTMRRHAIMQGVMFDSAEDGMIMTSKNGKIIRRNKAFREMITMKEVDSTIIPSSIETLLTEDMTPHVRHTREMEIDGRHMIIEITKHPLQGEQLWLSLWFFRDITEQKHSQQMVEFMAYHDPLTKLPNRYYLDSTLEKRMAEKQPIACLFFDVDRLKIMNDTLGHEAGDLCLKEISRRMKKLFVGEGLLVRHGGDEFVGLLVGERSKQAVDVAKEMIKQMREPFLIEGINIRMKISLGIAQYPGLASTPSELIRIADLAMYESKKQGKNEIMEFNTEMERNIQRRVLIEENLLQAVEEKQFYLLYQPKISLHSLEIEGVEALLRWEHPKLGNLSPAEFVPIIEEMGFIHKIGNWVVEEACNQWFRWHRQGLTPITMAVNISPLQFTKENFVEQIHAHIVESGMDPRFLELEMTESSSLVYEELATDSFSKLQESGVKLSIDDFGTGYSSFSQLRELPVETLKIDRSFLKDMLGNSSREAIVRSMIHLGHNLGMRVLVEGVEDGYQLTWLQHEGCDLVQGFYFSRPVHAEVIKSMLIKEAGTGS
ncbi:bifunctional diguanylate cyclase/phosphodiesterase [Salipaludibacillus daqingensis]|uniref:bifunctional diguanylate cyclase/phosphodiesterase n=1 Tax=Salipaludibacillus daqingensis TaxID=3041001 RepID=UPI0024738072|nr:EAL domain-containing protein [Salipaludibacillus daqingensis]